MWVNLINIKKFAKTVLIKNVKIFIIHIIFFSLVSILIYLIKKV